MVDLNQYTKSNSIVEIITKLRAEHPTPLGQGWDFDGFRVWVESDEPALIAELRDYFKDFRELAATDYDSAAAEAPLTRISAIQLPEPPDFGHNRTMVIGEFKASVKGPKEAFFDVSDGRAVHKLRTGMWFMFGAEHHLAIGPCTDNPNQVVNFINNRKIQWSLHQGAQLGHAAAVARREQDPSALPRTIAIAGQSGMGKSTLSLHLMNDRRLDFLSNDRAMICPRHPDSGVIEIEGVPKHPRINPGTILNNPDLVGLLEPADKARFEALSSDELWQLEEKYDGLINTCFPQQRFILRGRLVGLVLLNWKRDPGAETIARRINIRERADLLPSLIKKPGVFYLPGPNQAKRRDAHAYMDYLEGVEVLELAGNIDFERGAAAALELLGL